MVQRNFKRSKSGNFELNCNVCDSKDSLYIRFADRDYVCLSCKNCGYNEEFINQVKVKKNIKVNHEDWRCLFKYE